MSACKLDYKRKIVGLNFSLVSRLVAAYLTAFLAFVYNCVAAFFCVGLSSHGLKGTLALGSAVAGVYVKMERPQTKGAVISGGIFKGKDFLSAVGANKSFIKLCEFFLFHNLFSKKV